MVIPVIINSNNTIVRPGEKIGSQQPVQKQNIQRNESNFGTVLKEKLQAQNDLKFSKHAELRLHSRNINLSPNQMDRIKNGVAKAEEKGVKDSLIVLDNLALVVNVKNKTVVTAANTDELKENVFTNIDGAVIV